MKTVQSRIMRTDCTRDNVKVYCTNVRVVACGTPWAKRGHWISCDYSGARRIGRVIGRVICEGKIYVETVLLALDGQAAYVAWIEPEWIETCVRHSPREIFAFMLGEWKEPADIIARAEGGFIRDASDAYRAHLGEVVNHGAESESRSRQPVRPKYWQTKKRTATRANFGNLPSIRAT
jgi:hypothetical protein